MIEIQLSELSDEELLECVKPYATKFEKELATRLRIRIKAEEINQKRLRRIVEKIKIGDSHD